MMEMGVIGEIKEPFQEGEGSADQKEAYNFVTFFLLKRSPDATKTDATS